MSTQTWRRKRLRILLWQNPRKDNGDGSTEAWQVAVYEVHDGTLPSILYDYQIEAKLICIYHPERWDGFTRIPPHLVKIPGVYAANYTRKSFGDACKRAREAALTMSSYMTMEEASFCWDERIYPPKVGHSVKGAKKPKKPLKKAKPVPMEEPPSTDEEPDWDQWFPQASSTGTANGVD